MCKKPCLDFGFATQQYFFVCVNVENMLIISKDPRNFVLHRENIFFLKKK